MVGILTEVPAALLSTGQSIEAEDFRTACGRPPALVQRLASGPIQHDAQGIRCNSEYLSA